VKGFLEENSRGLKANNVIRRPVTPIETPVEEEDLEEIPEKGGRSIYSLS
jgi:hypothetical protein